MKNLWDEFYRDEEGATAIEYGLIALLISVAIVGSLTALGNNPIVGMEKISNSMQNINGS